MEDIILIIITLDTRLLIRYNRGGIWK